MLRVNWFAFNETIGFHGSVRSHLSLIVRAPNENIVQNHFNIALLNVF